MGLRLTAGTATSAAPDASHQIYGATGSLLSVGQSNGTPAARRDSPAPEFVNTFVEEPRKAE